MVYKWMERFWHEGSCPLGERYIGTVEGRSIGCVTSVDPAQAGARLVYFPSWGLQAPRVVHSDEHITWKWMAPPVSKGK